jgi:AcrR family transcriptional regulator
VPVLDAGEGHPPAPRQARSIEKKRQLLEAARRVFANRGYDAASVEDITARANVAVGAFYLYFRSKRQLLVELMNLLLQRLQSLELTLPAGADVRRGLRTFLRAALRADRENYGVVRAWNEAASKDSELAKMRGVIEAWTQQRVRGVLVRVSERLGTAPPRDLDTFARIVDRHLWMLLGRMATMSDAEFGEEVRVTSDMIYFYLASGSTRRARSGR